jgi:hypothetical protein
MLRKGRQGRQSERRRQSAWKERSSARSMSMVGAAVRCRGGCGDDVVIKVRGGCGDDVVVRLRGKVPPDISSATRPLPPYRQLPPALTLLLIIRLSLCLPLPHSTSRPMSGLMAFTLPPSFSFSLSSDVWVDGPRLCTSHSGLMAPDFVGRTLGLWLSTSHVAF